MYLEFVRIMFTTNKSTMCIYKVKSIIKKIRIRERVLIIIIQFMYIIKLFIKNVTNHKHNLVNKQVIYFYSGCGSIFLYKRS